MKHENFRLLAEDDIKRSQFIYEFLTNPKNNNPEGESTIPKVIVQYWHSLVDLPKDVHDCIESWKLLKEKGFSFLLFDDLQAKNFIENNFERKYLDAYLKCHHPAMRCDYFRLCYLYIKGGLYIDCDEFYLNSSIELLLKDNDLKLQPLCYSLSSNSMVEKGDFLNREYQSDYIYYFNNNPIASPPKHKLIQLSLERATMQLLTGININDIQSTTGPGNISASLVYYTLENQYSDNQIAVKAIANWEEISLSPWPLSYRNDHRNWRLHNTNDKFDTLFNL